MTQQRGFTLVEIALVLVIVGLLLGGLLKGQALIENARARAMAEQIDNIGAAWYGFVDRYRALPGDFDQADVRIADGLGNGAGDGRIDSAADVARAWQHLAAAGFIGGQFDGDTDSAGTLADTDCSSSTCPTNPFGGFLKITNDAQSGALQLSTGGNIPPRVLMQLDIKLDDGLANSGRFVVQEVNAGDCANAVNWNLESPTNNCAGLWRDL